MADKKNWYDEDDDDKDEQIVPKAPKGSPAAARAEAASILSTSSSDDNAKLVELMERVEPLVMSINTLMNQYAAGLEHRPPLERLAQLETLMNTLNSMAKPTPAYKFKYQNVHSIYTAYKTRWEKLKQDLESGKIKRFAAPKKRSAA